MADKINYQLLQAELDSIMEKLQHAGFNIEDAIKSYERGMEIVRQLENYLKETENKVVKLHAKFDKS